MSDSIKKIRVPTTTIGLSLLLMIAPMLAAAASPHFIGTPTITKTISGTTATLIVSGEVDGLSKRLTGVSLNTSGVTARTQCTSNGGNNRPGQTATFGPTEGQLAIIQPRNGQITFKNDAPLLITVTAEQAGCPNGMTPSITSATFSDVVLAITQSTSKKFINGTLEEVLSFNFGTVDP
jgi:hypothetical protein